MALISLPIEACLEFIWERFSAASEDVLTVRKQVLIFGMPRRIHDSTEMKRKSVKRQTTITRKEVSFVHAISGSSVDSIVWQTSSCLFQIDLEQ